MRQKFLFKLADLKQCSKTMIKSLKDALDYVMWTVRVHWFVLFVQNHIDQKERELWFGSPEGLDLVSGIVSVIYLEGVFYYAADR